jgi:hypothetical protein
MTTRRFKFWWCLLSIVCTIRTVRTIHSITVLVQNSENCCRSSLSYKYSSTVWVYNTNNKSLLRAVLQVVQYCTSTVLYLFPVDHSCSWLLLQDLKGSALLASWSPLYLGYKARLFFTMGLFRRLTQSIDNYLRWCRWLTDSTGLPSVLQLYKCTLKQYVILLQNQSNDESFAPLTQNRTTTSSKYS